MINEWTDQFNAFNPVKVLLSRQHLEGCAKDDYLAPIMANSYLTNKCANQCVWCINWGWRNKSPASMPEGHAVKLADFYKEWNIRSTCLGGGESTMHPDLVPFLYRLKENGIKVGIATNGGSHLTKEKLKAMAECSDWIGFSIDAGNARVYSKLHGVPEAEFAKVLKNMEWLADMGADVTYKMLLHPLNIPTIVYATNIARSHGATGIMMRPVGWVNVERTKGKPLLDFRPLLSLLEDQIEVARALESDNFKVYCVLQKFGKELETKVKFRRCWAAPLTVTFGADNFVYSCCDIIDREWSRMCTHYPEPREVLKFWNSEIHKKLVRSIDPHGCPRCTMGAYQEIIEKVIIEDRMMVNFP
jgi:MoaA/NifB/PqqE/SkfB family radical SAM enzyme